MCDTAFMSLDTGGRSPMQKIAKIPDRPNIYIHSVPNSTCNIEKELKWVVDLVRAGDCPKILIFAHSSPNETELYVKLMDMLGDDAYVNGERRVKLRKVELFTASTAKIDKVRIIEDFIIGNVDVLAATVAVGLGVNFPKVNNACPIP